MPSAATRLSLGVLSVFLILFVPALAWGQGSAQPLIVQPVDEGQLIPLPGNTYPLARAEFDRGAAPPDLPAQRMLLVLKRSQEQETALLRLLDDQQDKASPSYHKWLTPEQFGRQFGPGDQDIQTVTSWLQGHGFQAIQVTKGRSIVEFSGTAAQVQETFHTAIHKYVVNGEEHWANASDPQIPAALGPVVAGVATLHNFFKKPQISRLEKVPATFAHGTRPQVTFPNPTTHALGPQDYAQIYNINPLYQSGTNGNGVTIGVVGRTNVNLFDVFDFDNAFEINTAGLTVVLNGPDPGNLGGGEEAEALLDTTWSSALAPGARVNLVVSSSTNTTDGVDLSEVFIIDNNSADVMTESFGSCEAVHSGAEIAAQGTLAEQAAAQGITYTISTGDAGAEGCDNPNFEQVATGPTSVNYLASTPFNVAVGGTIFNEGAQSSRYWTSLLPLSETAISYIPENVWNESCAVSTCGSANANIAAGGGGASAFFSKPSWQAGVTGIPNDAARDQPDVSLTAAFHDAYLLCFEGSCEDNFIYFISGTSASAPSFAGIMALILDKVSQGPNPPPSPRQGQANYVLYRLASQETLSQCNGSSTATLPASNCVFNDVTVGNNAVPGEVGYGAPGAKYTSNAGYDRATGLGSVNVTNLANAWSSATFNPTTTTLSLSPLTSITHGSPVNVNISVTPNTAGGTPTGDVSLLPFVNGASVAPTGLGLFPLTNGSVSSTINSLPGGNYVVAARYSGDGTYAASTSAQTPTITISSEPSTTTITAQAFDQNGNSLSLANVPYGSFVYLRADVTGKSGIGTATGDVFFEDTTASVGEFALNSEGNTSTPQGILTLKGGQHSITARYIGDASFKQSTSSPASITVAEASTTTAVSAGASHLAQGTNVILTATVTAAANFGNPPSSTVSFFSGATPLGSAPVALASQTGSLFTVTGNFSTNQLPNGQDTITAQYGGDGNYTGSTSAPVTVSVEPDFSVSAGASNLVISAPGASGTLAITITGNPGYNSTINLSSASCSGFPPESRCSFTPASLTGSGQVTLTVATTAPRTASLHRFDRWTTGFGFAFAAVLFFGLPAKRRRLGALLSVAVCAFVLTSVSCGGSSNSGGSTGDPGTPPGQYHSTVTATTTTGLSHPLPIIVNVGS